MAPAEVLVTDAGTVSARWVIHAAVMDVRNGVRAKAFPSLDVTTACCLNSALGAWTGQLGVREPTRSACETLRAHPSANLLVDVFHGYDLDHAASRMSARARSPMCLIPSAGDQEALSAMTLTNARSGMETE